LNCRFSALQVQRNLNSGTVAIEACPVTGGGGSLLSGQGTSSL
jgi:hypothetical protein